MRARRESREAAQLRLAREVQTALLPPPLTALPGLEVAARFEPSRRVGGDFYDYFQLDNRYLGIYLGDVEGKGLEAAMYALLVSGLMRGLHKAGMEPAAVIAFLNRRMSIRSVPGKFSCLAYALINLESGQLSLANAGLPFPLLARQGVAARVRVAGIPIGMFAACEYDQHVVRLEPGDRLLFFTDGLPDSLQVLYPNQGSGEEQVGALLGDPRVRTAVEIADAFMSRLQLAQTSRRPLEDDAAFLVVRVL